MRSDERHEVDPGKADLLWAVLNYWLYAKPDVVNRWLRSVAIYERRLLSRSFGSFKPDRSASELLGFSSILSGRSIDLFQNYDFLGNSA
jgi:hypothetical protein